MKYIKWGGVALVVTIIGGTIGIVTGLFDISDRFCSDLTTEYDHLMEQAEARESEKKYEEALTLYVDAIQLAPNEQEPRKKQQTIIQILQGNDIQGIGKKFSFLRGYFIMIIRQSNSGSHAKTQAKLLKQSLTDEGFPGSCISRKSKNLHFFEKNFGFTPQEGFTICYQEEKESSSGKFFTEHLKAVYPHIPIHEAALEPEEKADYILEILVR